ncbi:chromosome-associated kinesin KIF4-like isoform X2 [Zonotrichia albicollis]|uniref:chromosome-associated kinesin KIF4-like isoform X1 n=1 Tax=Zonotrichia albicollis TaxID=44394 RepID=UPI003D80EEFC
MELLVGESPYRSAQIADLQQNLLDADNGDWAKQCWDSIATTLEAKCALKYLLRELVSSKVRLSKLQNGLQQSLASFSHVQRMLMEERNHKAEMETEFQNQILVQEQQHQHKVLYLLRQFQQKEAAEKRLEESLNEQEKQLQERLRFQEEELEKMREICEKHQELLRENDTLKQQLLLLQVARGQKLQHIQQRPPESPESPNYVPPKPKRHRQMTAKPQAPSPQVDVEELLSDLRELEGSDWLPEKAGRGTRRNLMGCSCKGRCGNRHCGCRRQKLGCTGGCSCSTAMCRNREQGLASAAASGGHRGCRACIWAGAKLEIGIIPQFVQAEQVHFAETL